MTGHVFGALAKRLEIGQLLEQSSKKAQLKQEKKEAQLSGGLQPTGSATNVSKETGDSFKQTITTAMAQCLESNTTQQED